MKQFIVLMAVLPFMLLFMVQFTVEQQHSSQFLRLQNYVYTAKEQAKQDGYFTQENIELLEDKICDTFDVEKGEIEIEATASARYRINEFDERELINYRVVVPVKNMMSGAGFFGISTEENTGYYVIENEAVSERLKY